MLVLADLDNTLVDRDGAFARWAAAAVPRWGGNSVDLEWMIDADARGYTPRSVLADAIIERMAPAALDHASMVDALLYEHVEHITCFPGVIRALERAAREGVPVVVLTNGDSRQQRMKLERTGLDALVAATVISGEVGVTKPDAAIFAIAQEHIPTAGPTWMVGDHARADMAGARHAGIRTAWVSNGERWPEPSWRPDLVTHGAAEALELLLIAARGGTAH